MSLTSRLTVSIDALYKASLDLSEVQNPMLKSYAKILQTGTGAGQADKFWHDRRTLAASTGEDLDLNGAALTDPFGAALAFVRVKGLIIAAADANTNNVIVGNAASNGFVSWVGGATHTVTLRPGAVMALFAGQADATGYAVTAGTADLLRVLNGAAGSTVDYEIIVVGASA